MTAAVMVRRGLLAAGLLAGLAGWWLGAVQAHDNSSMTKGDPFDPEAAIARSQAAIGGPVGDHRFTDEMGREVRLAAYRGKPLVIGLIYTACTHTCPVLVEHLAAAVEEAGRTLGSDAFEVVVVGFDSDADRPDRLKAYRREHGIDLPNWRFLSGDHATIDALIEDLGFIRIKSPRGFDHLSQTSIVDAEGRVFRQVYGDSFQVQALVEPLKALIFRDVSQLSGLSDVVERVRLFCTFYDARLGRYAFDYSFFISLAVGALTLVGLAIILLRVWLRSGKPPESPA